MTEHAKPVPELVPNPVLNPLSLVPGAMEVVKERVLPGGWRVNFEFSPEGWLKKDGTKRQVDHRAYYLSTVGDCLTCDGTGRAPSEKRPGGTIKCKACDGTGSPKRRRVDSATTICGGILPKDGLPPWAERQGIIGALEALRLGLLHAGMSDEEAVKAVRSNKLGADSKRDQAATRGLNVHALLETFMTTGRPPNPAEHPETHRPFIQGLVRWLIKMQEFGGIEPVAVEMLVADPERNYAGRLDLIARTAHGLTIIDAKTQQDGCIFEAAHVQCRLYAEAEERYGEHKFDHGMVVVFDGHGGFREMELSASSKLTTNALAYYADVKPLAAGCESMNRAIKQALKAAA